ncbi:hypothetical protein [Pectinatus frisingensis]|uniref:hypothetical protein n=1 Tax=Pectinatus frisingensis TaxID=865 RepID=UPI0018C5833E|nr:hypothetical protein [Pectinatus frisingensis]
MDKLVVGFVGGDTDLDKAIQYFSDAEKYNITHAFTMILDSTAESKGVKEIDDPYPGFWLHSPMKFVNDKTARFIEIDVPYIGFAEDMARKLIGSAYGYSSCLAFVLRKVFHINFPDNIHSCDCSEAQTMILRATGLRVYPHIQANEVSPLMAFRWVMKHGGVDVTSRYRKD